MTDAVLHDFLTDFDDSQYPTDFLQHYELMECLVHNEMGETLLVKDLADGKSYIAKCYFNKALLSQTNESELLKSLHHAGLPVYTGEYENNEMRCILREYAPGMPLDKLVIEKPLTGEQCIDLALQLCDILAYLHSQTPAVIHRDIKPQNIVVNDQGKITLIDFGISRVYDENAQEDTLCFGTLHYAAPEQYGFAQTDCRSDIYSLGVLLGWLFTGKEEVEQAKREMPARWLSKIVERCTAFAPKDRYKNVTQVRDALTRRSARRWAVAATFAALVILAGVLLYPGLIQPRVQAIGQITFTEPLIEQAVRLQLGKNADEAITENDLSSIEEIFVFGDKPAADMQAYNDYGNQFATSAGTVNQGSIRALDDLQKIKNLRKIYLADQQITDLSPLTDITSLEEVDLRHNPVSDVSPISHLPKLSTLVVFGTNIADLSTLSGCPRLILIDAGGTPITSMTAFKGLGSLQTLVLRSTPLRSLEGIDELQLLEEIYLSKTQLTDLSPLLSLPRLQTVEVDESMRSAAEAISDKAGFSILYP